MPIPIRKPEVCHVLRPYIGSRALTDDDKIVDSTLTLLESYAPYRETLEQLHDRLLTHMRSEIRRLTGGTMIVLTDEMHRQRLGETELDWLADDLMGVLFENLTPFSANFTRLNEYSLHMSSLSVLRVLYRGYRSFYTDEQYQFLAATIKRLYPPQAYAGWLEA